MRSEARETIRSDPCCKAPSQRSRSARPKPLLVLSHQVLINPFLPSVMLDLVGAMRTESAFSRYGAAAGANLRKLSYGGAFVLMLRPA